MNPGKYLSLVLLAALAAGGCNIVGPRAIEKGQFSYNEVINRTDNEQLLLNLVRLKYRDTPFFLEVANVLTQYSIQSTAGLGRSRTAGSPVDRSINLGLTYEENPAVSYAPLQGEKFVRQLLSPISLETMLLLYHSGWSIERIFRCSIQQLGPLKNAPGASGPTPDQAPEFREFTRAAKLLRELQVQGKIHFGAVQNGQGQHMVLRFSPEAAASPIARELRKLLGAGQDAADLHLATGAAAAGQIPVVTRSLMGVLFYLSHSIEVPEDDVEAGRVTLTKNSDDSPFDWSEVTEGLLQVRTGSWRPGNASVRIRYRGAWFYVDDSDLPSKSTFSFLTQLLALQSGEVKSSAPVLTIPIGG